jgi:hypothetical protein
MPVASVPGSSIVELIVSFLLGDRDFHPWSGVTMSTVSPGEIFL